MSFLTVSEHDSPSAVDFAFVKFGTQVLTRLVWDRAPADHAFVIADATCRAFQTQMLPSTWRPIDRQIIVSWIINNASDSYYDYNAFINFVNVLMDENKDKRSRQERRRQREPSQVSQLFRKAQQADNHRDRKHYLAQANAFLRIHIYNQKRIQTQSAFRKGCAMRPQRRLHIIKAMVLTAACGCPSKVGEISYDRKLWQLELAKFFGDKWGTSDLQRRALLLDRLAPFEGQAPCFSITDIFHAADAVKHSNRCALDGVSMSALVLICHARPDLVAESLHQLLTSKQLLEQTIISGQVKGKKGSISLASDVRCIVPLPAMLELADVLLADMLVPYIEHAFPPHPGILVGAVPGTQTLEVAAGLQTVVEKSLDSKGNGAVADVDIANFYDEQALLLLLGWLLERCPRILAAAVIKLQFYPTIELSCRGESVRISNRSRGTITGSRLANLLGRIPIQQALADCLPSIKHLGFPGGSTAVIAMTWIDNLFAAGSSSLDACTILETVADNLSRCWELRVKLGSQHYLAVDPSDVVNLPGWQKVEIFEGLGHFISADGSLHGCLAKVRRLIWKAYFAKFKRNSLQYLTDENIALEIARHLEPVLLFRAPSWPFQKRIAGDIDKLQAKIIVAATAVPRIPEEPDDEFHRRRFKLANALAVRAGRWSLRWAAKSITWHAHLGRNSSGLLWPAILKDTFGDAYLRERRRSFLPKNSARLQGCSELAGRTNTRRQAGAPAIRSFDGLCAATEAVRAEKLRLDTQRGRDSAYAKKAHNFGNNFVTTIDKAMLIANKQKTEHA
jgi:hypothetical protein